jgi:AcrR family transcriptional regulator
MTGSRMRREDWIRAALSRLESCGTIISVRALASDLGVTEGSFYHHFKGRPDLIRAVAAWWAGPDVADRLAGELAGIRGPLDRLRRVLALWQRQVRLDVALRRLAGDDPQVAAAVQRADDAAAAAVTAAFSELGFTADSAALRAKMLISFARAQHAGYVSAGPDDFDRALDLLTGRQQDPERRRDGDGSVPAGLAR